MKISKLIFHPRFILASIAALLVISNADCQKYKFKDLIKKPVKKRVKNKRCNLNLLSEFGFRGLNKPKSTYKLAMCPETNFSCCRMSDQKLMYQNWVIGNEQQDLEERLLSAEATYNEVLNLGKETKKRAEYLLKLLRIKEYSNCKVLAKRIVEFDIDKVSTFLKKSIIEFHTFLKETYNGFYCSICDFKNHRAFNFKTKTVNIDVKFCRKMVSHSLPYLSYLRYHLIIYMNFALRFMTYCDDKGSWKGEGDNEDIEGLMTLDKEFFNVAEDCKKDKDSEKWLSSCKPICDHFNVIQLNKFLTPFLFDYSNLIENLKPLIDKFEVPAEEEVVDEDEDEEEEDDQDMNINSKNQKKDPVEFDVDLYLKKKAIAAFEKVSGSSNSTESQSKMVKFKNPLVIRSEGIRASELNIFVNEYTETRGLNPFEVGKASIINSDLYQKVLKESNPEIISDSALFGQEIKYPYMDAKIKAKIDSQKSLKALFLPNGLIWFWFVLLFWHFRNGN